MKDSRRIAYLTNRYPAVSHSFIRREILAMEAMGHKVVRWSIRAAASDLVDKQDLLERQATRVLLERSWAICLAAARGLLLHPRRSARALSASLHGRPSGIGALVQRLAHFAEGCYLATSLNAERIEHVHVHFGTNPTAVARAARAMGGPPYSFTAHGPDEFDNPGAIGLGGKVADSAFAVAISSFCASQLMRWSRVQDWPRIAVVRCGVDQSYIELTDERAAGLSSNRLCCVARLAPQKGLPLLIEAASVLRDGGVEFELVIVGDGPLREELASQISHHRLEDRVRLHGVADSSGVRDVILSSRAMVLPSFAEGLPVVLMEALALGRPAVTTAIAGIPELVDSSCGWLVPAGSVKTLVGAMKASLCMPPEKLRVMGIEGRQRVLKHHDAAANAKKLLQLIEASHAAMQSPSR